MAETEVEADASADSKLCPFCAEEIKAAAIKCKHCQSDLSGAEPAGKPAGGNFICLVCRRSYPAADESCPQCGAIQGQNFVMAPGQAPPQSATRSSTGGPPAWLWWVLGLTMLTIAAVLIGVLASTKVGAAVAVGVIVLIYFAL